MKTYIFFLFLSFSFFCSSPTTKKVSLNVEKIKIPAKSKQITFPKEQLEALYAWLKTDEENFEFTRVKEFPQESERKVYEIFITDDEKYGIIVTRFKLVKISLETFQEVKILDHRRIVEGGFTGIGFSENGDLILAGSSWQTKASLYDWSGKVLADYPCGEKGSYVEDVYLSKISQKIILSCLQFGAEKKEILSFDVKGNLEWKRVTNHTYVELIPKLKKLISYEGQEVTIWSELGKQEIDLKLGLEIVSMSFASYQNLFLFGNTKEWNILKVGKFQVEPLLKINTDVDLFTGENYILNAEYKSFYKITHSGKYIFTGGIKGAYLWTVDGKLIKKFTGHKRNVSAVNFSNSEKFLITASPDRYIIWQRVPFSLN